MSPRIAALLMLTLSFSGCLSSGDTATVTVPDMHAGSVATYQFSGNRLGFSVLSAGGVYVDDDGQTVFPVNNGTLTVDLRPAVAVLDSSGRLGATAHPMVYTVKTDTGAHMVGADYLLPDGGTLITYDFVRSTNEHGQKVRSPAMTWAIGQPDVLGAVLVSGRTLEDGWIKTPWFHDEARYTSPVETAGFHVRIHGDEAILTGDPEDWNEQEGETIRFTYDATCPFPRTANIDTLTRYGKRQESMRLVRTSCTLGDGPVVTLTQPSPQVVGRAKGWMSLDERDAWVRSTDAAIRGARLSDATAAIKAESEWSSWCNSDCRIVWLRYSEWSQETLMGLVAPKPMSGWSVGFYRPSSNETRAWVAAWDGKSIQVQQTTPLVQRGAAGPGQRWFLDPAPISEALEKVFKGAPILAEWYAWRGDEPPTPGPEPEAEPFAVTSVLAREFDPTGGTNAVAGFPLSWLTERGGKLGSYSDSGHIILDPPTPWQ